jgi:hypothetical protein
VQESPKKNPRVQSLRAQQGEENEQGARAGERGRVAEESFGHTNFFKNVRGQCKMHGNLHGTCSTENILTGNSNR